MSRLTQAREKQLRAIHTDNRYGVLELLEEIGILRAEYNTHEDRCRDLRADFQTLQEEHKVWEKHSLCQLVKENEELRTQLESVKSSYAVMEEQRNSYILELKRVQEFEFKFRKENDALKSKLERTKEHHRKQREEDDEVEQTVFNEQEEEIDRLKQELKTAESEVHVLSVEKSRREWDRCGKCDNYLKALEQALSMVALVEATRIREEYGLE